ncbi:hypothetical protein [Candidatus Binatus sp.]|uniref:hypothetical protein n=1 Tax=Candidatus Binatus sp. TaxID=2811406 RepID=UPI003C77F46E
MSPVHQKIREHSADYSHAGFLCTIVFAILMIGSMAMAMLDAPVFADVSPTLGPVLARSNVEPARVQLAQADLPKGVGSISDYMHQAGDGPSTAAVSQPPQSFYPPSPQSYGAQGIPSQEWNSQCANPKISRDALIGTAIVGALAVGLWAYQQHEMHQAQQRAPRRFNPRRRAYR